MAMLVLVAIIGIQASAQRRVSPVIPKSPNALPDSIRQKRLERSRLVEKLDVNGNKILVDTVTGKEFVDSTVLKQKPKMTYPLIHEAIGGVNLWNPLMRAFGQHYGLADVWAELSLYNRYFPFVAIGVDNCNDTPDGSNFTFKVPVSPFIKIGASYNFFYNSNPDYKLQMGLRYGFTSFKWNVDNISLDNNYWGAPSTFSIRDQKSTAGYLEITFGIKVKIQKAWSVGWNIIYHSIIHETKNPHGEPMFIPGFGKRGSALTGSVSLMYTLPINKTKLTKVNNADLGGIGDDDSSTLAPSTEVSTLNGQENL